MSTLSAWKPRTGLGFVGDAGGFGLLNPDSPKIIQLENGELVVAWNNWALSGGDYSQLTQAFSTVGTPVGAPYVLTELAGGLAFAFGFDLSLNLSAKRDGGFIGIRNLITRSGDGVMLTEYTATGAVSSSNQIVVTPAAGSDDVYGPADIAASTQTSALIIYGELAFRGNILAATTDMYHLKGKFYNPVADTYSSEITLVNGPVENLSNYALANGNYLVVAGQASITLSFSPILGAFVSERHESLVFSIVTSGGLFIRNTELIQASVSENSFSTKIFNEHTVTGLSNSGFVVLYKARTGLEPEDFNFLSVIKIYSSTGSIVRTTSGPDGFVHAVVALPNAEFVVLYNDVTSLQAQHYSATGARLDSLVLGGSASSVEAVSLEDGRFAVAWNDASEQIQFQIFDTRTSFNGTNVHPVTREQIGTIFADMFTVGAGTKLARGFAGDDIISQFVGTNASGPTSIMGDDGNDTILMKNLINRDTVDGGKGTDTIDWSGSAEVGGVFNLTAGTASGAAGITQIISGFENLTGTRNRDTIIGKSAANVLTGLGGDDTISGGGGGDTLRGDGGNDVVFGGTGSDMLFGGDGSDNLSGGIGADTLNGGSNLGGTYDYARYDDANHGNLVINLANAALNTGAAAGDTYSDIEGLVGGVGNDRITGDGNANALWGSSGNDTIEGGAGADYLNGGSGTDTLSYSNSTAGVAVNLNANSASSADAQGDSISRFENLTGSGFNDTLSGDVNANVIRGGNGNDAINAWHGDDFIFGGLGNDTLRGSLGADRFYFDTALDAATNLDTITDFSVVDDFLMLDDAVFAAISATGFLTAARFATVSTGGNATTVDHRIVYEQSTGTLFHDTDGSGAGVKVQFATVTAGLALTAGDIWVY